jgi:hypothetical protein
VICLPIAADFPAIPPGARLRRRLHWDSISRTITPRRSSSFTARPGCHAGSPSPASGTPTPTSASRR